MQPKKILFLTSTNLACNPRCLKEIRLLHADPNIAIELVAFELHNWTTIKEKKIVDALPRLKHTHLETTSKGGLAWLISSLLEKAAPAIRSIFPKSNFWAAMTVSKRSWLLWQYLKRSSISADLVIAHNPPAFYPAWKWAKKYQIPFALDVEDYHPGEANGKAVQLAVTHLMQHLIPLSVYNSYAAPLIQTQTEKHFNTPLDPSRNLTIVNSFAVAEFISPIPKESMPEKLQLLWFSQFVDFGRGLEKILPVLDEFADQLELTLIGSMRAPFHEKELVSRKYIHCCDAMTQLELHNSLSNYDIGLALEDGHSDVNRNLCLTNKIWSYLQAGLYILGSDTAAQVQFQSTYPKHVQICSLETSSLKQAVVQLLQQKDSLRKHRQERFASAQSVAWEEAAKPLQAQWQKIGDTSQS